jgi:hypothetical protein
VSKNKQASQKKKLESAMFPNLSGIKFEDAIKAFVKKPMPKAKKPTEPSK